MADIKEILDQFHDYLRLSTDVSVGTKNKYLSIVRRYLLQNNMEITKQNLNEFMKGKGTRNTYINKYALKHFLISIGKKEWVDHLGPPKRVPRKKVFRYVNKGVMENIINGMPKKYRLPALLQYKTGVRFSEVMTIRIENIDFIRSDRFIVIYLGKSKSLTKGSKERAIHIHKSFEDIIRAHIKKPFGYLFLDEKCEDMDAEQMQKHLTIILNDYNIELKTIGNYYGAEDLSSHYLRHLFADNFLKSGGDPAYLQKALGHSDIKTTMGYVSVQQSMVENVLLKMEES